MLVTASGLAPARAQSSGPEYVVKEGDTLFSIARAFGITVEALQQFNNIADPSLLAVGQTLVIPGFTGVNGKLLTYRVQLGETLAGLAKRFGVAPEILIRLNRITNPESLYVGQFLIYPEGVGGLAAGITAVAAPGDSLAALAARSGQTVWGLTLLNDLDSPFITYNGQHLVIPGDAATGPALTGLPQPFLSLTLQPERPTQGGTLEVLAQTLEGTTLSGQFGQWALRFNTAANGLAALQGIHVFTEPGLYPLIITATSSNGVTTIFEQMVPVADAGYPAQQLYVGAEQSALLDPNVVGPEREQVAQIVSAYTEIKQWQGVFIKPVQSERITTGFGWRRSYNGGPFDSYHDGIDWGMPGGSPITAPAAGTVVFAGQLTVRGNATIIDHGWGVYTGYWHQFRIDVTVGQVVQAGELIGEVGSSGLSTGSHLHFVVWVNGNQVNPEEWLEREFP
ncbi:MAG: LysM peptidoglycan-binding domain-containing protein [Chloroflexi bacterium]|nr:LysM peptidoglycan-binding domain-containing protein [Chloroflexota bacterium]